MKKQTQKDLDLEFEELDFSSDNSSEHGLQMVYSDIVTLLLCFFILFVYLKENKTEFMSNLVKDLELVDKGSTDGSGDHQSQGSSFQDARESGSPPQGRGVIDSLYVGIQNGDVDGQKYLHSKRNETIKIYFEDVDFFERGSYRLAYFAKDSLDSFVKSLMPYVDKVWLTVQGFTDSTGVKKNVHYQSNLELSVLRSTSVYKYLISKGLPEGMISIQGFGEHRQLVTEQDNEVEEKMAKNRRIVLKIQSRL